MNMFLYHWAWVVDKHVVDRMPKYIHRILPGHTIIKNNKQSRMPLELMLLYKV